MSGYLLNGKASAGFQQQAGGLSRWLTVSAHVFSSRQQAVRYTTGARRALLACLRGIVAGYKANGYGLRVVGSRTLRLPQAVQQQGLIEIHTQTVSLHKPTTVTGDGYFDLAVLQEGRTEALLLYTIAGARDRAGALSFTDTVASRLRRYSR
jgi:hypothetical protein